VGGWGAGSQVGLVGTTITRQRTTTASAVLFHTKLQQISTYGVHVDSLFILYVCVAAIMLHSLLNAVTLYSDNNICIQQWCTLLIRTMLRP